MTLTMSEKELGILTLLVHDYEAVAFSRRETLREFLSLRRKVKHLSDEAAARKLLTISEAAACAKVSRRTIYNWLDDNRLEFIRTKGGRVRINEDSLWRLPEAPLTGSASLPFSGLRCASA